MFLSNVLPAFPFVDVDRVLGDYGNQRSSFSREQPSEEGATADAANHPKQNTNGGCATYRDVGYNSIAALSYPVCTLFMILVWF